jgi:hypothetical protein
MHTQNARRFVATIITHCTVVRMYDLFPGGFTNGETRQNGVGKLNRS